jgi:hypothetical protein
MLAYAGPGGSVLLRSHHPEVNRGTGPALLVE